MHLAPHEGKSFWLLTDRFTFKVVGADTKGAFAMSEVTANPGFGPPPHTHQREDEAFYILEGLFEISYEGRTLTARPGSLVYLPKGRPHQHQAVGTAPARVLAWYTPAGVERFIEEAGKPAPDPSATPPPPEPAELERIVAIAARYGITV